MAGSRPSSTRSDTELRPNPGRPGEVLCGHPRNDKAHHDGRASAGMGGGLGRNRTTLETRCSCGSSDRPPRLSAVSSASVRSNPWLPTCAVPKAKRTQSLARGRDRVTAANPMRGCLASLGLRWWLLTKFGRTQRPATSRRTNDPRRRHLNEGRPVKPTRCSASRPLPMTPCRRLVWA